MCDNPGETITERLEALRKRIYEIEKCLSKYGFDPRRGIESYKVSELKKLISSSRNAKRAKQLLLELIELQELLYTELYRTAKLKKMNVDTDTPEKRLATIKRWLIPVKAEPAAQVTKSKFKDALLMVARALETCNTNCKEEIKHVLQEIYKRDYDRCRVIKYLIELCISYGGAGKGILERTEIASLDSLIDGLIECSRKIGRRKLARLIEAWGVER